MDPTIVVAIVSGTVALAVAVFGLRASGKVKDVPSAVESGGKREAEEFAWRIARSTMEQQRARIDELEAQSRRREEQLRGLGVTPVE